MQKNRKRASGAPASINSVQNHEEKRKIDAGVHASGLKEYVRLRPLFRVFAYYVRKIRKSIYAWISTYSEGRDYISDVYAIWLSFCCISLR